MCEYDDIPGARSRQRFLLNGLLAKSRIAYQTAPLLRHEIRPGLFVFVGAGGAVTAVAGAEAVAVVDTRYGPRVAETGPAAWLLVWNRSLGISEQTTISFHTRKSTLPFAFQT